MKKTMTLVLAIAIVVSMMMPVFADEAKTYGEAPMLAALVAEGKLPPVEERLPEEPMVLTAETIGVYGGNMTQNFPWGNYAGALEELGWTAGTSLLYKVDFAGNYVGNLATEWSNSEDFRSFTFTLRKGAKWSDGEPFTTADVKFYIDTMQYLDPDDPEAVLSSDKYSTCTLDIADDYTFTVTFVDPQPFFYTEMSNYRYSIFQPAHYLKDFFKGTADAEALQAAVDESGLSNWQALLEDKKSIRDNKDLPTMLPWILTSDTEAATQLIWVRNPYYWCVDAEGNQLPYVDTHTWNIVETTDVAKTMDIAGEFDQASAGIGETAGDYVLFAQYMEEQNYHIVLMEYDEPGAMNIHINHASQDAAKRAILSQKDFRVALSIGMNREELIDALLTVGPLVSHPRNFSPFEGSPFFEESWSSAYTEFDPDQANALLDGLGLAKGDDGWRTLPDGSQFVLVIEVPSFADDWIDYGNMLASQWQKLGINVTARSIAPSLWGELMNANDYDITIFTGGGGAAYLDKTTINDYTGAFYYDWPLRYQSGNQLWKSEPNNAAAFEPDEDVANLWELGTELFSTTDTAKQDELLAQIFQIHKDQLFILGIGTRLPTFRLFKNYLRNVPEWKFTNQAYLLSNRFETLWIDETAK